MIIEMRSYDLRPGAVPEYEKAFAAGLDHRQQFSKLGAFWHTEFGSLNRVIHVWPYESMAERDRLRAASMKPGAWPPGGTDLILSQESKIIEPAPFSPALTEGTHGIYEIRVYTVKPGRMGDVIKSWAEMIPARLTYSPLIFAGATSVGILNEWIHVWAYKDLAERSSVRAEVVRAGIWPPHTADAYLRQEAVIALPATFSPLR